MKVILKANLLDVKGVFGAVYAECHCDNVAMMLALLLCRSRIGLQPNLTRLHCFHQSTFTCVIEAETLTFSVNGLLPIGRSNLISRRYGCTSRDASSVITCGEVFFTQSGTSISRVYFLQSNRLSFDGVPCNSLRFSGPLIVLRYPGCGRKPVPLWLGMSAGKSRE